MLALRPKLRSATFPALVILTSATLTTATLAPAQAMIFIFIDDP